MKIALGVSALLFTVSASSIALASSSFFVSGQTCSIPEQSLVPTILDSQGVRAYPGGSAGATTYSETLAICPVNYSNNPLTSSVTVDSMSVLYYDYDGQKPLSCFYEETNWDQSLHAGSTLYSGSSTVSSNCTATSCPNATDAPTWTGQGNLLWSSNPLSVTNQYPINANILCVFQASGGGSTSTGQRLWNYSYTIN